MTRIIAGTAKGRRLEVPTSGTRPTSNKVREAMFSMLTNMRAIEDAKVLDLFAGSGSLSLEALSRGAHSAVLVDSSPKTVRVAKKNVIACGFSNSAKVVLRSAHSHLERTSEQFDLVFVDPPYSTRSQELFVTLQKVLPLLRVNGIVAVERDAKTFEPQLPVGMELICHRQWGDTAAWFVGLQQHET